MARIGNDVSQEIRRQASRLAADRSGATAIEYALIAVFIAISIVLAAPAIGVSVNSLFTTVNGNL